MGICIHVVNADSASTQTQPLVITATKTEKALKDVPVRTEVVTAEALEKEHATNMVDVLRYVPGLLLQDIHGKTGKEVWIQGLDSDRVLVLIDGERVSASTGSTIDLSQLSIANIQQVEIIKGASSALHGSSAMGGVINIITKEPESGFHGKLLSSSGSYGNKNPDGVDISRTHLRGELSYRGENWSLMGDIDDRNTDGFIIEENGFTLRGEEGYKRNGALSVGYLPDDDSTYWFRYRRYREDLSLKTRVPGRGYIDRQEIVDNERFSFSSDTHINDTHQLLFKIYQETFIDETVGSTGVDRYAEIGVQGTEIQHNGYFSENTILTSGFVINKDTLEQLRGGLEEVPGTVSRDAKEVYFQLDTWLGENWEILPGLRYEKDNVFGSHTAPKISALYSKEHSDGSSRLRMSYGNGYRVPNLKERFYVFDHSHLGYMVLVNPDLEPESSNSIQLGYEFQHNNDWRSEINFFYNDIDDLIQTPLSHYTNIGGQPVAVYQYNNVGKALTQGLEVDSEFPLGKNLRLRASYTWLQKAEDKQTGKRLVKRPEDMIKAGLDWDLWDANGNLAIRAVYQSSSFIDEDNEIISPSWTQWDIKYSHTFFQYIRLYGGVDNIFDVHRDPEVREKDLRPVPGRYIYLGAGYSF